MITDLIFSTDHLHERIDLLAGHGLVQRIVHQHRRGEVAGPEAFGGQQGHAAVAGGLAGLDAKLLGQVIHQHLALAARATDRTAHPHLELAAGLVLGEEVIEAERVLHLGRREAEHLGDLDHGLQRHVAQPLVDDVQRRQHDGPPRRVARVIGLDRRADLVAEKRLRRRFGRLCLCRLHAF